MQSAILSGQSRLQHGSQYTRNLINQSQKQTNAFELHSPSNAVGDPAYSRGSNNCALVSIEAMSTNKLGCIAHRSARRIMNVDKQRNEMLQHHRILAHYITDPMHRPFRYTAEKLRTCSRNCSSHFNHPGQLHSPDLLIKISTTLKVIRDSFKRITIWLLGIEGLDARGFLRLQATCNSLLASEGYSQSNILRSCVEEEHAQAMLTRYSGQHSTLLYM